MQVRESKRVLQVFELQQKSPVCFLSLRSTEIVNRDGNISFGTGEMLVQNPFLGRLAVILN